MPLLQTLVFHLIAFLSLIGVSPLQDAARPPLNAGTRSFICDNPLRTTYSLHIPPDFDTNWPAPLVIVLSDGKDALKKSGWETLADRSGFLVAGYRADQMIATNLTALTDDIGKKANIDPARIFVVCWQPNAVTELNTPTFAALSLIGDPQNKPSALSDRAVDIREKSGDAQSIWRFFETHPKVSGPTHPASLTVLCTGLRNTDGQVIVSLFDKEEGFPDSGAKPFRTAIASIQNGIAKATFSDLPPGDYACIFLHDENKNGKMDTSLGFPLEGFGVSNNPKMRLGPPRFSDARFYLAGDRPEHRILIRAIYL